MADEEDRGWGDAPPAEKEKEKTEAEAEAVAKKDGDEASEGGGTRSSKRSKRSRSRSKESSRRRERKDREKEKDGGELEESSSSRKDRDKDKERKRSRRSRSDSRSRTSRRDRSRSRSRERSRRDRSRSRDRDSRSSRRREQGRSEEERDERTAEQREIDELTKDQRTVFVSQLVMKADERALKKFFTQFGKVRSVVMLRDKATNRHKGFAYVEMADLEAIPAVLLMNDQAPDFQKFPIKVAASQAEKNYVAKQEAMSKGRNPSGPTRRADRGLPRQVYLGNLHPNITEEDLMELLRPFGTVTKLVMARNEDGTSRGFAFATFEKVEEAQTVMTQLGGVPLADRPIKVGPVNEKADHSGKNAAMMGLPGGGGAPPGSATGNWRLDDSSAAGLPLDAHSRVALMAKLGAGAGLQVPMPQPPLPPGPPPPMHGGMGLGALSLGNASIPLPVQGVPGRCLLIKNLFDPFAPDQEDGWELDIKEDVEDECGRYGAVKHVFVDVKTPGGMVYVLFGEEPAATKAAQALNGRWFAGRMVSVEYLPEGAYKAKCPDAPLDG